MRTISVDLKTELASVSPRIARLVRITQKNGTVFGFTDHDMPLLIDGVTHNPAPGLNAIKYTTTADAEVSTQNITAGWVDVPEENLRGGLVDDATIEAAWCAWANPGAGQLVTFEGKLGEISWNDGGFEAQIVSFMKQLERNVGWTYTANCRHELYGQPGPGKVGACTVDPALYTFTGTVGTIILPKWKFEFSGAATGKGDGYFSGGIITFTSGLNNGFGVEIKTHSVVGGVETFVLFIPVAFQFPVGTTFSIKAGCDKTAATCKNKFNNIIHHGGFPHINPNVQYR